MDISHATIARATVEDAEAILSLQKLAYQSEAARYPHDTLPPLAQTLEEIKAELQTWTFLKVMDRSGIIGSVRAHAEKGTCFIGRLIVHPQWQGQGIGTRLMAAIEADFSPVQRFELFTGTKSRDNLRLYQKLGYRPCRKEEISSSLCLVFLEKFIDR